MVWDFQGNVFEGGQLSWVLTFLSHAILPLE